MPHLSLMKQQVLTRKIALTFSRKKGKFSLHYGDHSVEQNVCEFLQTMSFLVGKDIEEHQLNNDMQYDTVRIPLTNSGKTLTLNLIEFIRFREAYGYQMFLLKLEDVLMHKRIQLSKAFLD